MAGVQCMLLKSFVMKTRSHLVFMACGMVANNQAPQEDRAQTGMVLTHFFWNIAISAPEGPTWKNGHTTRI